MMNDLIIYILEVIIVSSIFYLGYLGIQRHSRATIRRFYLLGWLFFSILFPFFSINTTAIPTVSIHRNFVIDSEQESYENPLFQAESAVSPSIEKSPDPTFSYGQLGNREDKSSGFDWNILFISIYSCVALFFIARMLLGIFQIWKLKKASFKTDLNESVIYELVNSNVKGASFFGWIFIGKLSKKEKETVFEHEKLHSKLGHSLDILVSHIYSALFWINPLSWVLKKFIALNTELQVDEKLSQQYGVATYADFLFQLSSSVYSARMLNHFSAKHLKYRITRLNNSPKHSKWVPIFIITILAFSLFSVSCDRLEMSSESKLKDIKTIITRFKSHQTDTQQKTGKVVAIASFLPDGTLDEFVEQTTYPYDHEFDRKKEFWEQPDKVGIPYIMDGLSLGEAEKSILYGSDWPSSYANFLQNNKRGMDTRLPWLDKFEIDNLLQPTEIKHTRDYKQEKRALITMPDITEFFSYENGKIVETSILSVYPEVDSSNIAFKAMMKGINKNLTEAQKRERKQRRLNTQKRINSRYTYDGDLLTNIVYGKMDEPSEYKFYYADKVLIKTEYYRRGELLNTRVHHYKSGLKDRTEIFNRYNEPEYTITYSYEYW